jgi:hypothetical protein
MYSSSVAHEDVDLFLRSWPGGSRSGHRDCDPTQWEERFWRIEPALFLASDLFPAIYSRRRSREHRLPLAAASSSRQVFFSGERLDQADLDVLLLLLQFLRRAGKQPGEPIRVQALDILRPLGRKGGAKNIEWLLRSMLRLESGRLLIKSETFSSGMRLLNKFLYNHESHDFVAVCDRDFQKAFAGRNLDLFLRERLSLDRDGLAKWLHALAWSVACPFCFDMRGLQGLSGLGKMSEEDFESRVLEAAGRLEESRLASFERFGEDRCVLTHHANPRSPDCCRIYP